ncbi:hypothetical protein A3H85_01240 [Candidatus Daviesbacteria bacterium RIFCSPLOWO2_02_FULL_40_8]|uniref:F0F1 ATP synthase subunit alpha n=1 Tax=Candidatus Daviesbacteria bacterium RIFCSPLOWO2_01_FULL_40_24 TaxID=1797787 RepID=A0A1F5MKE9_9BACT|nr:MAG: hypothetical protein A2780_00580 [Candidatus Daviesbacteria bacterium RIFCSPHIGHO2_01_FULL_41_45]OGE34013.1 MAG: hypothetical protein A3C32_01095 [Candidatus Daviesbacteria bacterium RIFCSPHIGHO2_02_FULL_41_14]OGE65867.1 MAG: hypothetical protein A3B49_02855 [Candidatus Daviesbacteria bacterium RIFCSPLOWO2_01_FULL_40_24]OGE67046.1 MAG: hypothetical protein A3H85_01240 [Candidatus Daviesbacteria bacterium RIFCSPLOWO2_02_FULL_40_8]
MPNTPQPTEPTQEIGFALSVRGFLIQADGLPTVKINDLVATDKGARGWINGLLDDRVQILMLDESVVEPRTMFKKTGVGLNISLGPSLLGRVISPIGTPLDGKSLIKATPEDRVTTIELEQVARGIDQREEILEQFDCGISLVDTLIPLGKGQRELVIGDARAGKTRFLVDLVTNQKGKGLIVIYALIGKPISAVRNLINILGTSAAMEHTIVVAASSNDPPPLVFLAPHTAITIAEYFQAQGRDVLVILDDMGNHAKVHREISLLSNKFPGRESYPGDIFYQHAHLMERAGKFKKTSGGGSITLLPVIEIILNDFTTYIPNSLMSMTDGHLLFKSDLASVGQFPAIDLSLSVSRVGRQTQNRIQNGVAYKLRQILSQAQQYETLSQFSAELPQETQIILRQKELIEELIKQDPQTDIPKEVQTVLLALVFTNWLKFKDISFVKANRNNLLKALTTDRSLKDLVSSALQMKTDDELIAKLETMTTLIQKYCV